MASTLQQLFAQTSILHTLHTFHTAQDTLSLPLLKPLLHPSLPITLDMTAHLPHIGILTLSPSEFYSTMVGALGGFTATQHVLGNSIVEFKDEEESKDPADPPTRAVVKSAIVAYHCIGEGGEGAEVRSVTARARQEVEMEVWEGEWKIRGVRVVRDVPMDNPGLYAVARERVEKGLGRVGKE